MNETEASEEAQKNVLFEQLTGLVKVDPNLEKVYSSFGEKLALFERNGISSRDWFAKQLNNSFNPAEPITATDLASLEIVNEWVDLHTLRERYGFNYQRSVLYLSETDLEKVRSKIPRLNTIFGLAGVSFIFATLENDWTIMHEIKHSIDPNRNNRLGKERILEEFAAYWEDVLKSRRISVNQPTPKQYEVVVQGENMKSIKSSPAAIGERLKGHYFNQFKSAFENEEEFKTFVDEVTRVITSLREHFSDIEIDRIIMNSNSVEQLQQLLEFMKKKKQLSS